MKTTTEKAAALLNKRIEQLSPTEGVLTELHNLKKLLSNWQQCLLSEMYTSKEWWQSKQDYPQLVHPLNAFLEVLFDSVSENDGGVLERAYWEVGHLIWQVEIQIESLEPAIKALELD